VSNSGKHGHASGPQQGTPRCRVSVTSGRETALQLPCLTNPVSSNVKRTVPVPTQQRKAHHDSGEIEQHSRGEGVNVFTGLIRLGPTPQTAHEPYGHDVVGIVTHVVA